MLDPKFNVDDFLKTYKSASMKVNAELENSWKRARENALDDIRKKEEREETRFIESLAEYQYILDIQNEEDLLAYTQKLDRNRAANKLAREVEMLKATSKETEKEDLKREAKLLKEKKRLGKQLLDDEQKKVDQANKDLLKDVAFKGFKDFRDALQDKEEHEVEVVGENIERALKQVGKNITEGLNQINTAIGNYAKLQTNINTRLQGLPSYTPNRAFSNITSTLGSVAYSPLVNAEDLYQNINTLVSEGIGYNIEQRGFLMTIKDAIATTFDANSESLRRLIRIQQEDSTAARLGMESYLTRWLNAYVENTEYLTQTFDNVADNLLEATAMLGSNYGVGASAEFEYTVQKWLGALTGVGLSSQTATSIATALGQIGSGDISNLGSSGIQNLLVMAASKANLSYADLLTKGLDAVDTNKLLYFMTDYMKTLGASSNNVVKSALASTFGVTVSDLVSVSGLATEEMKNIYENMMSYSNMYGELADQLNSVTTRMGIANLLENAFANLTYQTGMSIASTPALYATWKITDLIQSVTGGINIPFVTALGSGIDLNTTVENLMKLGIVGAGMLGNIGNIVNAVGSVFSGASLLSALKISENTEGLDRGTGLSDYTIKNSGIKKRTSGTTISASSYIGNKDYNAYYDSTLANAQDQAQTELDRKTEELKENDPVVDYLTDLEFADSFKSLVSNVESLRKDGVIIQRFASDELNTGFTSFFRMQGNFPNNPYNGY